MTSHLLSHVTDYGSVSNAIPSNISPITSIISTNASIVTSCTTEDDNEQIFNFPVNKKPIMILLPNNSLNSPTKSEMRNIINYPPPRIRQSSISSHFKYTDDHPHDIEMIANDFFHFTPGQPYSYSLYTSHSQTPDKTYETCQPYSTPHHGEAHRIIVGKSPIKRVIFNMLTSILGAGLVGLPFVFNTAGLAGGLFLMFFFAYACAYTLRLLIIVSKVTHQKNYEDVCEYVFGLWGYYTVSSAMFIFDYGASLSYLIILGDSASAIMAIWDYNTILDRQLIILCFGLFVTLPVCLPRDISAIERVSTFTVGTIFMIMVVVVYEWIQYRWLKNYKYTSTFPVIDWFNFSGMSEAVGIIAFSFVCHDSSFLLYNTLANPTLVRYSKLACSGLTAAVLICSFFAVPAYLTFGKVMCYLVLYIFLFVPCFVCCACLYLKDVQDNILNNYEVNDSIIIFARCVYVVTMALTYPMSFFVCRHVLYAVFHHGPNYESIQRAPLWKHLLVTLPLFFSNLVLGLFVQNLGIVMSVSGSLSAVVLAFVLPCMCYLKVCKHPVMFWTAPVNERWIAFKFIIFPFLLLVMGIFIAVFSTLNTLLSFYGVWEI